MERGDVVGAMLEGSSLNKPGDASSGLAMRKPPRDWERLKSPSIAGVPRVKRVTGLVLVYAVFGVGKMAIDNWYKLCGGASQLVVVKVKATSGSAIGYWLGYIGCVNESGLQTSAVISLAQHW